MKKTDWLMISWLLSTAIFFTCSIQREVIRFVFNRIEEQGFPDFNFTPIFNNWLKYVAMFTLFTSAILGVLYLTGRIKNWRRQAVFPRQRDGAARIMTAALWSVGTPIFIFFFLCGFLIISLGNYFKEYKYVDDADGQAYILIHSYDIDSHSYYQYKKVAPCIMVRDRKMKEVYWNIEKPVPPEAPPFDW